MDSDSGTMYQWVCTTLYLVTALSIILSSSATQFTIHLGSNSLNNADPNRVTVATSTYIVHPEFDPDTLEHDIGLLRLRLPVDFNGSANIVCQQYLVTNTTFFQNT